MSHESRQSQRTASGSVAIQSSGDTNITIGMTPEQMKEIQAAISVQIRDNLLVASSLVEQRIGTFEEKVYRRFGELDAGRREAFKDPDFQYLLGRAEVAYARSGDENTADILVDLIAERSKSAERNRLLLSLDEAVERATRLTANEFAVLSICYIGRYTKFNGVNSLAMLGDLLNKNVSPLLDGAAKDNVNYSIQYLLSHSCGSLSSLRRNEIIKMLGTTYGGVISKGFTREMLDSHLPDGLKTSLDRYVIPCINDESKLQFDALNKDALLERVRADGADEQGVENTWNMFSGTFMNKEELATALKPNFPRASEYLDLWSETDMGALSLTPVGIAIAHANLVRVSGFKADLSIWIK